MYVNFFKHFARFSQNTNTYIKSNASSFFLKVFRYFEQNSSKKFADSLFFFLRGGFQLGPQDSGPLAHCPIDSLKILPKFSQHFPRIFARFSQKFHQNFSLTFHYSLKIPKNFLKTFLKRQNTGSPYHYFHHHLLLHVSHSVTRVFTFYSLLPIQLSD